MDNIYDFSQYPIDKEANYGGSDHKWGILKDNARYMIKVSDRIDTGHRNELNSSYSNSIFSEYVCCHILNALGFKAQDTLLGIYRFPDTDEIKNVVACKNFIKDERYKLIEFKDIENTLLNHKPPKIPKIEDIYSILSKSNVYFDTEMAQKALCHYWDVFVLDALLANFDRHANNWGYILDRQTNKLIDFAPIYDCGSCLYPQIADDAIPNILNDSNAIEMRIKKFPNGALEINNRKVNYFEYLNSLSNQDVTDALLRIYPRIDMSVIQNVIDTTPMISDIRKTFYRTMLGERYDKILTPAYTKAVLHNRTEIMESDNICGYTDIER